MARSPSILASSATVARGPDAADAPVAMRTEQSLDSLADRLAEVAQALRRASQSSEVNDLATFGASISSALGDLAVTAELTANAVIDADRPALASRTRTAPSPAARTVSWRLHALASELRGARDVSEAVRVASGDSGRDVAAGQSRSLARHHVSHRPTHLPRAPR
jgi:hypothetical protein